MATTNLTGNDPTPSSSNGTNTNPAQVGTYTLEAVILTIFATLAMHNSVELLVLIFSTFKTRNSLYFWSLLVATIGVFPFAIGELIEYYYWGPLWLSNWIDSVGWAMMITGQSLVLYSRLHFVVRETRILRAALWMIIIDAILVEPLVWITDFLDVYNVSDAYNVVERFQLVLFCLQELTLSSLYIWKVSELLKGGSKERFRSTLIQLLAINCIVIMMDLAVVALEFANLYNIQVELKGYIYSMKLKFEFAILNKLVDIAHTNIKSQGMLLVHTTVESTGESGTCVEGPERNLSVHFEPLDKPNLAIPDGGGTVQRASSILPVTAVNGNGGLTFSIDDASKGKEKEREARGQIGDEEKQDNGLNVEQSDILPQPSPFHETYEDIIREISQASQSPRASISNPSWSQPTNIRQSRAKSLPQLLFDR